MSKDPLQAESVSAMNKIAHAKSMTAGMGMQLGDERKFLNPSKHFFHEPCFIPRPMDWVKMIGSWLFAGD
jgi:hypothetical protein